MHPKEFVTLNLADKPYTFRALDLDQLETLEPSFAAVAAIDGLPGTAMPKAAVQAVAEIAAASLLFKHADMTAASARKLIITLGTIGAVMAAVRGVSQLDAPAAAAGAAPGEALAGS